MIDVKDDNADARALQLALRKKRLHAIPKSSSIQQTRQRVGVGLAFQLVRHRLTFGFQLVLPAQLTPQKREPLDDLAYFHAAGPINRFRIVRDLSRRNLIDLKPDQQQRLEQHAVRRPGDTDHHRDCRRRQQERHQHRTKRIGLRIRRRTHSIRQDRAAKRICRHHARNVADSEIGRRRDAARIQSVDNATGINEGAAEIGFLHGEKRTAHVISGDGTRSIVAEEGVEIVDARHFAVEGRQVGRAGAAPGHQQHDDI